MKNFGNSKWPFRKNKIIIGKTEVSFSAAGRKDQFGHISQVFLSLLWLKKGWTEKKTENKERQPPQRGD